MRNFKWLRSFFAAVLVSACYILSAPMEAQAGSVRICNVSDCPIIVQVEFDNGELSSAIILTYGNCALFENATGCAVIANINGVERDIIDEGEYEDFDPPYAGGCPVGWAYFTGGSLWVY